MLKTTFVHGVAEKRDAGASWRNPTLWSVAGSYPALQMRWTGRVRIGGKKAV